MKAGRELAAINAEFHARVANEARGTAKWTVEEGLKGKDFAARQDYAPHILEQPGPANVVSSSVGVPAPRADVRAGGDITRLPEEVVKREVLQDPVAQWTAKITEEGRKYPAAIEGAYGLKRAKDLGLIQSRPAKRAAELQVEAQAISKATGGDWVVVKPELGVKAGALEDQVSTQVARLLEPYGTKLGDTAYLMPR